MQMDFSFSFASCFFVLGSGFRSLHPAQRQVKLDSIVGGNISLANKYLPVD